MGLHNEILVGRVNRFAQKYFGLKGGPPAPQLSSEIQIQSEFFSAMDNRFLESWFMYGVGFSMPATVGQTVGFQLRITSPSTIAILQSVKMGTTLTQEIDISEATSAVLGALTGVAAFPRDLRCPNTGTELSQSVASPGATNIIGRVILPANQSIELIQIPEAQIIVTPGTGVRFTSTVANQNLIATIFWMERALEESELK